MSEPKKKGGMVNSLNLIPAGGSTSADLLQALEEYLPVLLGLVKEGKSCILLIFHLSFNRSNRSVSFFFAFILALCFNREQLGR
jgi:hypothetical protein